MAPPVLEAVPHGSVSLLSIRRPHRRNALDAEVVRRLREQIEAIGADESIRAVVITGDDVAFSSGQDLKEPEPPDFIAEINRAFDDLEALPRPTIAAIGGWCIAGGLELAMACDLRVAARDARIGDWHVRIGSIGGAGATVRLVRLIGLSRAKELVLLGDAVDGAQAARIGLVHRVCEPNEQVNVALDLAARLAEHDPSTIGAAKRSLGAAVDLPRDEALAFSLELQQTLRDRRLAAPTR